MMSAQRRKRDAFRAAIEPARDTRPGDRALNGDAAGAEAGNQFNRAAELVVPDDAVGDARADDAEDDEIGQEAPDMLRVLALERRDAVGEQRRGDHARHDEEAVPLDGQPADLECGRAMEEHIAASGRSKD